MTSAIFHLLWETIKTDRAAQSGAGTSAVSLWGSYSLGSITTLQTYVSFFAALFGGLSALATFVYVTIKIVRLLKQPKALD